MNQLGLKQFSDLTSILFSTALDSSRWQEFLSRLSSHTQCVNTHLYGYDIATRFSLPPLQHGYDPAYLPSYVNYYSAQNPWAPGLARAAVGQTVTTAETLSEQDLMKTEFYNDWLRPQGDLRAGGGVVLANENGRFFVLGGNIAKRHADNEQGWLRTLTLLSPHMQHALAIARVVFAGSVAKVAAERLGTTETSAVFAVDAQRRVIYANRPAQSLVEGGSVLGHGPSGRLAFDDADIDHAFALAVAGMGKLHSPLASAMQFRDCDGHLWNLRLANIEGRDLTIGPPGLSDGPLMLIALSRDEAKADRAQALRRRFGLTSSEAEVALGLGTGLTLREIADHRGTSLHTVRDQLKAALSKTGTRRQVELVRIVERHQQITNPDG